MKSNDRKQLLGSAVEDLQKKLQELQVQLVKASQERYLQDRTQLDVKQAYKLRKQIKLIKTELRRRELETTV